jgi:hypothetical protein
MNTRSVLAAGVFFLLFTVSSTSAQDLTTVAKVLPTDGKSVIKLLVVDNPGKLVSISFYSEDGVIATDDIRGEEAHGFIRKYDLSRVSHKKFKMHVTTENSSFTYEIVKDGNTVMAELRETTQTFPVLAAR